MAIDYSFFTIAFRDTIYFNISWAINLVATALTLVILTRDTQKWKSLAFPITVAWHIAGLPPSILIYAATALMFAIDNLSLQAMGQILDVTKRTFKRKETVFDQELAHTERKTIRKKIREITGDKARQSDSLFRPLSDKEKEKIIKRGR